MNKSLSSTGNEGESKQDEQVETRGASSVSFTKD